MADLQSAHFILNGEIQDRSEKGVSAVRLGAGGRSEALGKVEFVCCCCSWMLDAHQERGTQK